MNPCLRWKRFPLPLLTKLKRFQLEKKLFDQETKKTEECKDIIEEKKKTKAKIERQNKFVNISMITEATMESSFQLWFQTHFLFPMIGGIKKTSYSPAILMKILSVLFSFCTTAYTMVVIRFSIIKSSKILTFNNFTEITF